MTTRTKQLTLAVTGTAVLASAAYGLGTQAGDGNAVAAKSAQGSTTAAAPPARRAARTDLAQALGVSEERLRSALQAVREKLQATHDDRRAEHAKALADALGISQEKVQQAFEAKRSEPFAAVAKALGKTTAQVTSAFEKARDGDARGRRAHLAAVADELGVSVERLRAALRDARPSRGSRADHRAELAKALGVTEAQLEAATAKLRDAHEQEREARRAEFAKLLAAELGLDQAKVAEALEDAPAFGGGPGHHRGGPGFGHGSRRG